MISENNCYDITDWCGYTLTEADNWEMSGIIGPYGPHGLWV